MHPSHRLATSTGLFEFSPGRKAPWSVLANVLPDIETALFFAAAYKLPADKLSELLHKLFKSNVLDALRSGEHSTELQDYIVDTVPEYVDEVTGVFFTEQPPKGELLVHLWENIDITIAQSIQEVANNLSLVLNSLPSKQGQMMFKTLAVLNKRRPTIGDYRPVIHHQRIQDQLVIFDDSGSMGEGTVRAIANEVVALSYNANATLALVSNTARVWEPGTYGVGDVLMNAQYGGTRYETLAPLLNRNWANVITIADYDSSRSAKQTLSNCTGRIGRVLDLSLVNRPTFLSECVGQLADEVKPLLISNSDRPIS